MDKVTECLNALIEEMRESRAYQNYLCMEQELEKDPELEVCKMVQKVQDCISEAIRIGVPEI